MSQKQSEITRKATTGKGTAKETEKTGKEKETGTGVGKTKAQSRSSASTSASRSSASRTSTARPGNDKNRGNQEERPSKGRSADTKKAPPVTEVPRSERMCHQVLPYIMGVVAIFLTACFFCRNTTDRVGVVGRGIDKGLTGLLGWAAFLIPAVLLFLAVYWRKLVDLHLVRAKVVLSGASIWLTAALTQVLLINRLEDAIYAPRVLWENGNALRGGGVLGGWLGSLCWQGIGFVGSVIVLLPLILIFLMFLMGVTPRYMWTRTKYLWKVRSDERAERREQQKAEEAERLAQEEQEYYAAKLAVQQKATESRQPVPVGETGLPGESVSESYPEHEAHGTAVKGETAPSRRTRRKNAFVELDEMREVETSENPDILTFGKDTNLDELLPGTMAASPAPVSVLPDTKDGYRPPELIIPQPEPEKKTAKAETAGSAKTEPVKAGPVNPLVDDEKKENRDLTPLPVSDPPREDEIAASDKKQTSGVLTVEVKEDNKMDKVDLQSLVNVRKKRPTNPLVEDLAKETDYHDVDDLLAGVTQLPAASNGLTLELKPIPEEELIQTEVAEETLPDGDGVSEPSGKAGTPAGVSGQGNAKTRTPRAGASVMEAATGVRTDASGEAQEDEEEPEREYVFPPIDCLALDTSPKDEDVTEELRDNATKLMNTLSEFNVRIKEITYSRGPTITRYELKPDAGIRVRSIANLVDDIALSLATTGVRIEAPIPNKPAVGIEVPNRNRATVYLRELIDSDRFREEKSNVTACLGMDVAGKPVYFDVAKMPHLLIAGATGMGKSVCINSIIVSILYRAKPEDVRLVLIDPKKVEFNIYRDIPLLAVPIVVDTKKAAGTLAAAVAEMERRFELIEMTGVRDIKTYNEIIRGDPEKEHLSQMVIVIDELAELMMVAKDQVETSICRIAQKGRAAGMHLIIGTQRPSVDVITGVLKANIPSRIACTVASQVDSRTIIDIAGAEKLIGRGDMLFAPVGISKPQRVQGAFVSESEVENIVSFVRKHNSKVRYNRAFIDRMEEEVARAEAGSRKGDGDDDGDGDGDGGEGGDSKFKQALRIAVETGKISTSLLQRKLEIGYGRAAKIIDQMEELGYVSPADGNKPRKILISKEEFMEKSVNGDFE